MTRSINQLRGFTIVELLIVIVVIAILASISIVSYNGIQNRAKATAAATTAKNVSTKAEMTNTLLGAYPSTIANFNANTESQITGSGLALVATTAGVLNATNGTNSVTYEYCSSGSAAGGARVGAFNYNAGSGVTYTYLGNASSTATCSVAWTVVTGS